jgi:hypothetical protein
LKKTHDATWKKVYWPDAHCTWVIPAIRRARALLRERTVDALVTVALPFSAHLVGLALQDAPPSFRWLCDMSDPFTYLEPAPPNNTLLYGRLNRLIESRVFERAHVVAVTCDATAGRYSELYPSWRRKFVVIPHLWTPNSARPRTSDSSGGFTSRTGPVKLVYVGTLDGTTRNPGPFLDASRLIAESGSVPGFEVHFYGQIENCDAMFERHRSSYGRWLFVHGLVDRQAASRAVANADILVNIGNRYQCQLPSKLVDYGSTGKPIVNVIGCSSDLSQDALRGYRAALHLVSQEDSLSDAQTWELQRFLTQQKPLGQTEVDAWTEKFTLRAIVSGYEQHLGSSV